MVEGPGCKLKGEILHRRIRGKVVVDIRFIHQNKTRFGGGQFHLRNEDFRQFIGETVVEVRTLGKELFVLFSNCDSCIRLHFLMEGSIHYGSKIDNLLVKYSTECNLLMKLPNENFIVCKSAVALRSLKDSVSRCDILQDLDICSSLFNFERAVSMIQQHSLELICDVVMDQDVLPGVGNIIKNEGLFRAGINPNTKVINLSPGLIRFLVHRLRDFSAVFYNCRKERKSLKNNLCIYEKELCTECGNSVTVCKPGKLARLTFFCQRCQTNEIKKASFSLPQKNTLLGFLQVGSEDPSRNRSSSRIGGPSDEELWKCEACTFLNNFTSASCEMCQTIPPYDETRSRKTISTLEVKGDKPSCEKRLDHAQSASSSTTLGLKSTHQSIQNKSSDSLSTPLCLKHQKPCVLQTVKRAGDNRGRLFYCCCLPRGKQCQFFQWADLHFPLCDHGKIALKRRVLKLNENNGKEFFSCSRPKGKQCGFFQWA